MRLLVWMLQRGWHYRMAMALGVDPYPSLREIAESDDGEPA